MLSTGTGNKAEFEQLDPVIAAVGHRYQVLLTTTGSTGLIVAHLFVGQSYNSHTPWPTELSDL